MKTFTTLFAATLMCCVFLGCDQYEKTASQNNGKSLSDMTSEAASIAAKTKVVRKDDLCAKCGCCARCLDCCKMEKCEKCGMQAGTPLCCTGVKPAERGIYCKKCGFLKGTEDCCAESNVTCEKCGLAKGSPICCKLKQDVDDDHDHGDQHQEGDDDDHEDDDDDEGDDDDAKGDK